MRATSAQTTRCTGTYRNARRGDCNQMQAVDGDHHRVRVERAPWDGQGQLAQPAWNRAHREMRELRMRDRELRILLQKGPSIP